VMSYMTNTPYRVLARKYRPTSLQDLVGQSLLVQTLQQAIEANRMPHAFLLHGIRGVGKTTTARILARSLNCLGPDGQGPITITPCGVCASCIGIAEDRHLDVLEMDAASRTGVDDIREITESARYKAVTGRFKIFIMDEVHMLSKSAFNALLKTLEEPPAHVKFIFATTEIRKIPETILSRCMRFDLKRIEPKDIMDHLSAVCGKENFSIEQDGLAMLARAADGSMRDALSLLDQAMALASSPQITTPIVQNMLGLVDRGRLFSLLHLLFQGKVQEVLESTQALLQDGGDPTLILHDILDGVYWLTCLKTAPLLQQDTTYPEADRTQGMEIIQNLAPSHLMTAWQALLKGYEEVNTSPLPHQTLQMVLIRLCHMAHMPPLEDLLLNTQSTVSGPTKTRPSGPLAAAPLPTTFQNMLTMLEQNREPLLASQLVHDVHLVSYSPLKIIMRLSKQAQKTLPSQLKEALYGITQQQWTIVLSEDEGAPTLAQVRQAQKEEDEKALLDHPTLQAIRAAFPGAITHVFPKTIH
jgi:DNA polymerase-3 subunit gamma/tau